LGGVRKRVTREMGLGSRKELKVLVLERRGEERRGEERKGEEGRGRERKGGIMLVLAGVP